MRARSRQTLPGVLLREAPPQRPLVTPVDMKRMGLAMSRSSQDAAKSAVGLSRCEQSEGDHSDAVGTPVGVWPGVDHDRVQQLVAHVVG